MSVTVAKFLLENNVYKDHAMVHIPTVFYDQIMDALEKEKKEKPATDAVQVVRCKDCKHRISCSIYLEAVEAENEDWFCASGER